MRELLIGDNIANTIRMTRSQHTGTFVIVEGGTDSRFYKRFMHSEYCWFMPANGKEKAVGALQILDGERFTDVLAIVDADFWRIEGKTGDSPNLFLTDGHDLEMMIFASSTLEKILTEWGSEQKIKNFVEAQKKDIRQALLDVGLNIGYLRLISLRDSLSLKFEEIEFQKFINHKTFEFDVNALITVVKNKSQQHDLDNQNLQQKIAHTALPEHDSWEVCCGHDLVEIFSLGLTRIWGSNKDNDVRPEQLEKILRIGYEFSDFIATDLYQSLKDWENTNPSYPILAGGTG